MSLDVYLYKQQEENEIQEDWVYWANITHNLGQMAAKANLYVPLWRPEELNISFAKQLIPELETGLKVLKKDPNYFKRYDASNGWGIYENLVEFVEKYLIACCMNPDATIKVSR